MRKRDLCRWPLHYFQWALFNFMTYLQTYVSPDIVAIFQRQIMMSQCNNFLLLIFFPSYVIQLDRELRNRKVFRKRKSAAWKGSYMQTALTLMELINISCNVSYAQSLRYYVCNAKSFLKIIAQGSIIVGPNKFALHMAWLLDIHYWLKTTPW